MSQVWLVPKVSRRMQEIEMRLDLGNLDSSCHVKAHLEQSPVAALAI